MKIITLKQAYSKLSKAESVVIDDEHEPQTPLLSYLTSYLTGEGGGRYMWLNSDGKSSEWIKFYAGDNEEVEAVDDYIFMIGVQNGKKRRVRLNLLNARKDKQFKLRKAIDSWVSENHPDQDILLADGFEEAFMGIAYQFDKPIALFDKEKCIAILARDMSREEAEEYFSFNVEGAYVGPQTPAFFEKFKV